MRQVLQLMKRLGRDEEGAALVEYTVLLGIMLVAVIFLGPGAFSVDARVFGPREIIIPPMSPSRK